MVAPFRPLIAGFMFLALCLAVVGCAQNGEPEFAPVELYDVDPTTFSAEYMSAPELKAIIRDVRAAIVRYPKEKRPERWADFQAVLGIALFKLGRHTDNEVLQEEAAKSLGAALAIYDDGTAKQKLYRVRTEFADVSTFLGKAILFRMDSEDDTSWSSKYGSFADDLNHMENAISVRREIVATYDFGNDIELELATDLLLGGTLMLRGAGTMDSNYFEEAISINKNIISQTSSEYLPELWAAAHYANIGALAALTKTLKNVEEIEEAIVSLQRQMNVLNQQGALEEFVKLSSHKKLSGSFVHAGIEEELERFEGLLEDLKAYLANLRAAE